MIVPRDYPRVLPEVEPVFPFVRGRQLLVLDFYIEMQDCALSFAFYLEDAGIYTRDAAGRDVKRQPYGPDRATRYIELFKWFEPVRQEKCLLIGSDIAVGIRGIIRIVRDHIPNHIQMNIPFIHNLAVGTDKIMDNEPHLFESIRRPDEDKRIHPIGFPAGSLESSRLRDVGDFRSEIKPIARRKRNPEAMLFLLPAGRIGGAVEGVFREIVRLRGLKFVLVEGPLFGLGQDWRKRQRAN